MSDSLFLFNPSSLIDWIFLFVVLISGLLGLIRGALREAFSLFIWSTAVWLGIKYHPQVVDWFPDFATPWIRLLLALLALLFVVLLLGAMARLLVKQFLLATGAGLFDKSLGLIFGVARGVLISMLVVFVLMQSQYVEKSWWQDSGLIKWLVPSAEWLEEVIPEQAKASLLGWL